MNEYKASIKAPCIINRGIIIMKSKAIISLSLNCISYAMESNLDHQDSNSSAIVAFVEECPATRKRSGYLTQQEQEIMHIIENHSNMQESKQLFYYSYRVSTLYSQGVERSRILKQFAHAIGDEQQPDVELNGMLGKFYQAIGEYGSRIAIIFNGKPDELIPSWQALTDMMFKVKAHEPSNYLILEATLETD
jgi:hypothetical protein